MLFVFNQRKKMSLLSAAVLLTIVFVLCGSPAQSEVEQAAPDFSLLDLNGRTHNLFDYKGKVVVLNFWASWCGECIKEMPSLNTLHEQMKNRDVVVLGISIDRSGTAAGDIAAREKITYPILLDNKGKVFVKKFTVIGLPTTFIIDRKGVVREVLRGRTDFASKSVIDKIQTILDKRT